MPHDHDHHHDHHHSHDHSHSHDHDHHNDSAPLSLKEQLTTLLGHWVDHNEAHKGNYLTWAERARGGGYDGVSDLLKEIVGLTESVTERLKKAQKEIDTAP
ncbi:hypothetical protein [Desulfoluna spongiiphila]|uniref:DUF8180 domain-containing protein n=1 Tax=Desulfoluna spongiiphila TaxID=419481 RepID=A0A1G5INZ3_9BACT|nr:hypothetical protein [Desulfoluna spongiiphila]SCY77743.1 hypothetical protein SAMN05216233_12119 [Desulfoluna spongiiphila]VVS92601.1 consensus disorder prediction [Desulfoluna spongiiphila]